VSVKQCNVGLKAKDLAHEGVDNHYETAFFLAAVMLAGFFLGGIL
jgi:hypothetical protein